MTQPVRTTSDRGAGPVVATTVAAIAMLFVGLGVGMTQQNLVLAVQNTVAMRNMGSASSTVTFFRSVGGSAGISSILVMPMEPSAAS